MADVALISGMMIADVARQRLEAHGITVLASDPDYGCESLSALAARIRPQAIIVRTGILDADLFAATKTLKVVAKHGVGVDMIDVEAATRHMIPVMITPGANARSVAEHALTLLLCVLKDVPKLNSRLRRGHWDKAAHQGSELTGKRIGLIGFGRIAREFAALLSPFNVDVAAYTRKIPDDGDMPSVSFTTNLDKLLAGSDIVSLHCPLNAQTRMILGREQIAALRPGAVVINTARGGLIDESALLEALQSGKVSGAGLDCFSGEPVAPGNPLVAHPGVVSTPHISWATEEAATHMGLISADNILSVLSGQIPARSHTVNYDALFPPVNAAPASP